MFFIKEYVHILFLSIFRIFMNFVNGDLSEKFERTNFRKIEFERVGENVDLVVIDVSFISLRLIFPKALEFLKWKKIIIFNPGEEIFYLNKV